MRGTGEQPFGSFCIRSIVISTGHLNNTRCNVFSFVSSRIKDDMTNIMHAFDCRTLLWMHCRDKYSYEKLKRHRHYAADAKKTH